MKEKELLKKRHFYPHKHHLEYFPKIFNSLIKNKQILFPTLQKQQLIKASFNKISSFFHRTDYVDPHIIWINFERFV